TLPEDHPGGVVEQHLGVCCNIGIGCGACTPECRRIQKRGYSQTGARRTHGMRSHRSLSWFLLVLMWAASSGPAAAQQSPMQSVTDPKGRFTIQFPAGWQVLKPENGVIAVLGVAPAQGQPHRASVNVVVEDLPRAMSSETYAGISEGLLRRVFHGYTIVQQGSVTIAGQAAYYRYYTWQA